MGYITKAEIDAADDRRTEDFEVPEWGGTVRLKVMSAKDIDYIEALAMDPDKHKNGGARAKLVALCLVDEKGKRVYSDADVRLLGAKSGAVLTRLFMKCVELNKIEDAEVEELVEDFEETPDSDSSTD